MKHLNMPNLALKNTFTIYYWLMKIKPIRSWVIARHWQKEAAACHIWEKGEYTKITWTVADYAKQS